MRKLRPWVKTTLLSVVVSTAGFAAGRLTRPAKEEVLVPVSEIVPIVITKVEEPVEVDYRLPSKEDVEAGDYGVFLPPGEGSVRLATRYGVFTEDELNTIFAVVRQEGGPTYESAQAVMSTVINRLNSPEWSWCGNTVMEQLTYPSQFCYSLDNYWKRYLDGNVEDAVKEAVVDVLNGNVSHSFTSFRGGYVNGGVNIGDNWYF